MTGANRHHQEASDAVFTLATIVGDGAHADGRALLLRLSAWHLWLDRPDGAAEGATA